MARHPTSRKASFATTVDPTEDTPLLQREASRVSIVWSKSLVYRVLLTGFLVSLSFGVTQVPLIYVFGVMDCDEYYRTHPEPPPGSDRCKIHSIEASTARQVALLGAGTTLFGVVNLFFTGWTMKAFGVKKALLLTVFFPAVRLAIQNVGVTTGAGLGMVIVQCSQMITVVGGPVGYLLALNSLATEVVEPAERTAVLGRLSGCAMFGTAIGFLVGGILGDSFEIIMPFRVAVLLFILCCIYVWHCLPDIHNKEIEAKGSKSLSGFFDPIKMFAPQKWRLRDGRVQKEYGVLLLGVGVFLGVLATSYIPVLLQMYSIDIFGFGTTENGWLIFLNSLIRGLFLTLAFPYMISGGRKWLAMRKIPKHPKHAKDDIGTPDGSINTNEVPTTTQAIHDEQQTVEPSELAKEESYAFDLHFTKYSLIADGLLTGLATFMTEGWQMYLIAVILPLASGTGPAAKGTILQMCPASQRQDALSAISLVELLARLTSTGIFGMVFSAFADLGRPNLTFACNAAIAVVGFVILMFARFPREGSTRWVTGDDDDEELT